MNRLQSHENGPNSPKFYVNSPAINRKFVKIGSHFHGISLRFPNYQTRSENERFYFDLAPHDETWYKAPSATGWAVTTNLPIQIGMMVARNPEAVIVDINPTDNPFRQLELATRNDRGIVLAGPEGECLPELLCLWET